MIKKLRVDGYSYIGAGNSTNKKDAQTNAALDFCQYLVRMGSLNQNDLPKVTLSGEGGTGESGLSTGGELPRGLVAPHQSMGLNFNETNQTGPNSLMPYKRGPPLAYMQHINDLNNRRMLQEAEDSDVNAEIHGFWTIENAKSRLHQYLQSHKINTDYKYSCTGPDNNKFIFFQIF